MMEAPILDNMALASLENYAPRLAAFRRARAPRGRRGGDRGGGACGGRRFLAHAGQESSGGNQQKVVLGKWLLRKPTIFVLDEPTRGIDVGAKYEVYKIIAQLAMDGAGVLFISSEIEELIGLCDRIMVMAHGEIRGTFSREEFDRESILRLAMWHGIKEVEA